MLGSCYQFGPHFECAPMAKPVMQSSHDGHMYADINQGDLRGALPDARLAGGKSGDAVAAGGAGSVSLDRLVACLASLGGVAEAQLTLRRHMPAQVRIIRVSVGFLFMIVRFSPLRRQKARTGSHHDEVL